jgi:hypothetical protein
MGNSNSATWKDPYEEKLKNYLQQIENRKQFSFDVNKDAMYQQLKENYDQQGKLAMENAMGQAAAMTGGYGNSYAQTVGQQVYMQSMKDLNEMVPTIQSMAQEKYDQETNDLYTKYSLYKGLSDESYNKHLQELSATSGGNTGSSTSGRETKADPAEIDAIEKKFERCQNADDLLYLANDLMYRGYSEAWVKNLVKRYDKWKNTGSNLTTIVPPYQNGGSAATGASALGNFAKDKVLRSTR